MELIDLIISISAGISTISAAMIILCKPFRDKITGIKHIQDGQRCLLRSDILDIYYKHKNTKTLHQYEYENFLYLYDAYKSLSGNSFVDKIKNEIESWNIER